MGRCIGIQSSVFLYALLPASVSGWWVGSEPRTTLSEGGGDFYLVRRCLRVHSSMYPYSLPHARGSIPEGPSVAGYTGGGDTSLEETERPLLAQEGPTQAR